jgi:hypothetical protein
MKRSGAARSSTPSVWEVSRLGPVQPAEGPSAAFFVYVAARANSEPLVACEDTDESGLAALLERAEGAPLRCDPALESAARRLGVACSALSAAAYRDAAHLAVAVASGSSVPLNRNVIPAVLLAASGFVRREPWHHWPTLPGGVPTINIKVRSPLPRDFPELSIFVQRGEKRGYHSYFLFEEEGSSERLVEACTRGPDERDAVIAELPSLLVQLSEGAPWAVAAIERAYGSRVFPAIVRGSGDGMLPCDEIEAAVLTCTLEALSRFRGEREVAYTKTPEGMVSVELTNSLG